MGILNSLGLLEEGAASPDFTAAELITMARQNAQRLQRTLSALLDLAALESGTFHARLREVDLHRLVTGRSDAHLSLLRDRGLSIKLTDGVPGTPLLGDPQKFGRALDLCFQILIPRAEQGTELRVRIAAATVEFEFQLASGMERLWEAAWSQAVAGYQGGVAAPGSAFAGVLQSEQAFLTRAEEGLGSEFLLVHEILRLHRGVFTAQFNAGKITLRLELPTLSSEEGLRAVLNSRTYEVSTERGSVALVLVHVPSQVKVDVFCAEIRRSLFRASDAVYALPTRSQVALVMDDCKPEDAPPLMARISQKLKSTASEGLLYGAAHSPADGLDPGLLIGIAESRLAKAINSGKASL